MLHLFHFRSFLNFLRRNQLFTAINIFGFSVSLIFVILLGLYIQDETSVNATQPNKARIYRLTNENGVIWPVSLGPDLLTRYPEFEAFMRFYQTEMSISDGTHDAIIGKVDLMDSSLLSLFELPWVEGSPETAMRTQNDVLISQACANQWFPDGRALGRTIRINNKERIVSGVFRDLNDTHFETPHAILRFENADEIWPANMMTYSGFSPCGLYLMTHPNSTITRERLDEMLAYFQETAVSYIMEFNKEVDVEPLEAIYYSDKPQGGIRSNNKSFLLVLGGTALLILLFAIINYINLSVAQSGFRAQEAAMRRLLGGTRTQLFLNFVFESMLLCAVSFLLALLFASSAEPWFQQTMQTDISIRQGLTLGNIVWATVGVALIGIVSGVVPASVLTRFKPIDVVRGTFRRKTKMVYSKILIAFQYCITIVLLGSTITIIRQIDFMCNSNLGFNHDNILVLDYAPGANGSRDGLRNVLSAVPGVEKVAFAIGTPATTRQHLGFLHGDKNINMQIITLDTTAWEMMKFRILKRTGVDSRDAVWLNRYAWHELEISEEKPSLQFAYEERQVAGMMDDFHTGDMGTAIGPIMVRTLTPDQTPMNVLVQVSGDNQYAVANRITHEYMRYNGGTPVKALFMDDAIQQQYTAQQRMARIITSLALLAILISALGMLAMSTYFMRQRAQEVAVRKVFGASEGNILTRLVSGFLKLVVIAFVIAVPVTWYLMSDWLNSYVYHIRLSWLIFAAAGAIALTIAFLTVLWQSLKATRANPILAIRD